MLKLIKDEQRKKIHAYMQKMSLEEKAAQVQCVNGNNKPIEEIRHLVQVAKVGSLFASNVSRQDFEAMALAARDGDIPVIVCGDLVNGAGSRIYGGTAFPHKMGCAATDSEEKMEMMGEITAREGRAYGAHWTFAPVVDLCFNYNNPMMHIRTSGDDPYRVLRLNRAFVQGVQKEGLMAATAKHFPGDGTDSRDTHVTTLINHLTREEWEKTYGVVWRGMIESGVMTIMGGHIALPFIDPEYEEPGQRYKGPRPATLSCKIQLDFLRGVLGFEGAIVSDALGMVGFGAHLRREDYGWKLLEAGSDMLLWTIPEIDTASIVKAVKEGKLTEERLNDAVRRVLELKARVGLLDVAPQYPVLTNQEISDYQKKAQSVADASITLVRDVFSVIPLTNLKAGDKVLTITVHSTDGARNQRDEQDLEFVDEELKKRGLQVDHLVNPNGMAGMREQAKKYAAVFVNIKYPPRYGSVRLCGDAIQTFKGSWWVDDSKVVFTSFGDPYKIYDLPSLHSYINAYSYYEVAQKAAVKVWLGEIKPMGKLPINMDALFQKQL